MSFSRSAAIASILVFAAPFVQAADEDSPNCFDALVSARIVKQTPTPIPDCGKNCFVMRWPWIDEIDVTDTLDGIAPRGHMRVLTIQHTDYRPMTFEWALRRNSLGGFNAQLASDDSKLQICRQSIPPEDAYVRLRAGQTLDDVERDGEREFDRR
jgi:hypothetical protein